MSQKGQANLLGLIGDPDTELRVQQVAVPHPGNGPAIDIRPG
jgi:hypothetical protein